MSKRKERAVHEAIRRAWPVCFRFLTTHPLSREHAEYHGQLVRAEVYLHRLVSSHADGVQPVNLRITRAHESTFQQHPTAEQAGNNLAEHARWFNASSTPRRSPLHHEALLKELIGVHGISARMAESLINRQSHALYANDQAWLEQRRRRPALTRPLTATEYAALVRSIECAYRVPADSLRLCGENRQLACQVAAMLGRLMPDGAEAPFHSAELVKAYQGARKGLAQLRRAPLRISRGPSTQATSPSSRLVA